MAKKIAPPETGKHQTQSLLTDGGDKDTKFFSQDKIAPNPLTGEFEAKLLGRGATGANAAAAENPKRSDWKTEGWDINREAKKLAQKAIGDLPVAVRGQAKPANTSLGKNPKTGKEIVGVSEGVLPRGNPQSKEGQAIRARVEDMNPNDPKATHENTYSKLDDARMQKSDFDDLVSAINLNIINSYSKFRNKKDLDFSAFDKKPEGKKTKLDPEDNPKLSRRPTAQGLGESSRGQLRGLKGRKGKPATGQVFADPRILTGRRHAEAKPQTLSTEYTDPKSGEKKIQTERLNITPPPKKRETAEPKEPLTKNPYRQDEKGKYVRGTGYDKKITGSKTRADEKRQTQREREAHPATRYNRRHEGKLQHGKRGVGQFASTGDPEHPSRILGGRPDDVLGIETQEPLSPHKHVREQDKEGKVVRNRLSTDPSNVKWQKGGRKRTPADAQEAIRQGVQNLKGMDISYKGSRMGIKLKGERHASRGRADARAAPLGGEERGKDWFKYWKDHTEKSLDALAIKIKENIEGFTPTKETFGDPRWRVPQIKHPKNEKEQVESKRRADLSRDQWVKEFATHYTPFAERVENEAREWQKKKMALLKAFLSPITFKYKWGNTYERGQTKNVETQDHSRTGNTNNDQTYKKDKDDLTIKSLDEVFNSWKNGKKE